MNYDYRNRERYSNLKVTKLTPAQIAAFHEQLRLEDVRAQLLRAKLPGIIARAEAKRAAVIADAYARAQARYATKQAIRAKIKPIQLPLPLEKIA